MSHQTAAAAALSSQACLMPAEDKTTIAAFARRCNRATEPAALVYTIDAKAGRWKHVSTIEPCPLAELVDELEDVNAPRFVLYIYPYQNGDFFTTPIVSVHYIPKNMSPETKMMVSLAKEQFDELTRPQVVVPLTEVDLEEDFMTDEDEWKKRISVRR